MARSGALPASEAWPDLAHGHVQLAASSGTLADRNTAWLADGHSKCWMRIRNGTVCTLLVMVGLMWLP